MGFVSPFSHLLQAINYFVNCFCFYLKYTKLASQQEEVLFSRKEGTGGLSKNAFNICQRIIRGEMECFAYKKHLTAISLHDTTLVSGII